MIAIKSQGTTISVAPVPVSGEPVYVVISGINSFKAFDGQATEIDITTLSSTAKEKMMGLQDWGQLSLDVNYLFDDDGQVDLRAAKADSDPRVFKITFSDTTTAVFHGYVLASPISAGVDAKLEGTYNVTIDGDVTFAGG